jgi:hypothetical protein
MRQLPPAPLKTLLSLMCERRFQGEYPRCCRLEQTDEQPPTLIHTEGSDRPGAAA